jgi:hypothetical protein
MAYAMTRCRSEPHQRKRVVLTGGPGAGKTVILELIRKSFCEHMKVLPESASIVFGGGFPRTGSVAVREGAQRAIIYVQRELEAAADSENPAIVLCDRGTVDGGAHWPTPEGPGSSVGTTIEEQLRRDDAVIHLRTPTVETGYDRQNPLRIESGAEAAAIDARIAELWEGYPRRFIVDACPDFIAKGARAVEILRGEMPECCRNHPIPFLNGKRRGPPAARRKEISP